MAAGTTPTATIIDGIERGLYLTGTIGFGENLATGDFSRGGYGIWIEGGALTYPVDEFNIAGRLHEMLANIEAVGDDVMVNGNLAAPTFRIARMVVSGT
jgi:PmbA protein